MPEPRRRSGAVLLNVSLLVLGLGVLLLGWGLVTRFTASTPAPVHGDDVASPLIPDVIQVEVRNGSGVSGLAARTLVYLRSEGFDVVQVGDYSSRDLEHSIVYDRVGNLEVALSVARALGIPDNRVVQDVRTDFYLDASVIIGLDYQQLRPFQ